MTGKFSFRKRKHTHTDFSKKNKKNPYDILFYQIFFLAAFLGQRTPRPLKMTSLLGRLDQLKYDRDSAAGGEDHHMG